MCKLLHRIVLTSLLFSANTAALATEISIQLEGQWTQENVFFNPSPSVGISTGIPVNFSVAVTFDPSRSTYNPAYPGGMYTTQSGVNLYMPASPYSSFNFIQPRVTSSIMAHGVENPYAANGVDYSSGAYQEMQAFAYSSGDSQLIPNQKLEFYTSAWSSQSQGTFSASWNNYFRLQSPVWGILPSDMQTMNESALFNLFSRALRDGETFSASFISDTMTASPQMMIQSHIALMGSARITSISTVPEPESLTLVLAGLFAFFLRKRRSKSTFNN